MSILGLKVRLRAIEETDLAVLHQWANDANLWTMLGGWHFPTSLASTRSWFEKLHSDTANQRFIIETLEAGDVIGTANLVSLDWKNRNAFHGMSLGSSAVRGKGYGLDTVMAMMRYVFDELGLERLDGDIISYNEASLALYVGKCGWTVEGRQRRWHYRKGQFWDKILVGITRDDYYALAQENGYWNS
jgi:RimJ/RimL family protein N-acetyltransferase